MKTRILTDQLEEAAAIIRAGGLVAVPTETVYGLAANGLDPEAVERIYEVKGRPSVKPLSLMVPGSEAMALYCRDVPDAAGLLADAFWPGPLTIVLKAKDVVPSIVLAGGDTVGLRCPDHPLTLELLKKSGVPFAAPSANPSGEASPKTAQQVQAYFDGEIEAILDGGLCGIGTESTLISLADTPYRVLRQGALGRDQIADALVRQIKLIGITGGSGSGKSTALKALSAQGALVLDCDKVYHELLSTSPELVKDLSDAFPGTVKEGRVDRRALAGIVFRDEKKLEELNLITHRHIMQEVQTRLRDYAMSGGTLAALDASELIESGLAARCSLTIGILANRETRVSRIMARDSLSREAAELRINAQHDDAYYGEHCDLVLKNDADEAAFLDKFNVVMEEFLHHG